MSAITFTYDGRTIEAQPGQSVAGALHAAGVDVLTRSMKYRRQRGIYCAGGYCPNCLMRIDGLSFKRACAIPARQGMVVESQSRGMFSGRDPLRLIDYLGFVFPLGFQYRYFKRQGALYNLWESSLRRVAGHAPMPPSMGAGPPVRRLSVDLCVVGAGPAGIGATAAAIESGISVVTLSSWWGLGSAELVERRFSRAPRRVREAALRLVAHPDVVLAPARAIAWFDGVTVVDHDGQLVEVSAPRSVLATGAYERALVFDGNDLPGVMLSSAAVKLAYREGVKPGMRAAVITHTDDGYMAALDLAASEVEVVAVLDERATAPSQHAQALTAAGIPLFTSARVVRALGSRVVSGLVFSSREGRRRLKCDLVAMSGGWQPADGFRYQATSHGQIVVEGERAEWMDLIDAATEANALLQGVGAVVGTRSPLDAFHEGYIVGLHAARAAGLSVENELEGAIAELASKGQS